MSEEAGQTTTTAGETTEGKINIAEEMDAHEAMQKIRGDIAQTEPLIGPQEPISVLEQEFKGHEERLAQLEITKKHYSFIRRMRRDGDCFYRGYLCGLLEFCADKTNIDAASKLLAHFKEYLDILSIFHEKFLIEDFHALLQEQMEWAIASNPSSADIAERVSEPTIAMTVITMARLMCGGDMRSKPDQYEWIAPPGTTLDQFIASEVEPLGTEADHVQIAATAKAFGFGITVVYLDKGRPGELNVMHAEGDIVSRGAALLFRPGHYDVLYA